MRWRLWLGMLVWLCWPFAASSQECAPTGPTHHERGTIRENLAPLFVFPLTSEKLPSKILGEEWLIVPGERVGPLHLGSTSHSVASLLPLGPAVRKTEPRYQQILPLAYSPEREFRESAKFKIVLAMVPAKDTIKEIFVKAENCVTSNQIRVGSSQDLVQRYVTTKPRVGPNQNLYYVGDGITFVVAAHQVVEIVITEKLLK